MIDAVPRMFTAEEWDRLDRGLAQRVRALDAFVADVYAAIRGEGLADGVPMFRDGLRAAQIIDAVIESAREERWTDVAAVAPAGVA